MQKLCDILNKLALRLSCTPTQEATVEPLLILVAGLATTYLVARASGGFSAADAVIGLFAGAASVGLYWLGAAEGLGVGVPIFVCCALALGLESRPRRLVLR